MRKKYLVELTKEEREYLHKLISAGTAPARKLNRARILLKADVGKQAEANRPRQTGRGKQAEANRPRQTGRGKQAEANRHSSTDRSPGCSRPPQPLYKGRANAFTREGCRLRWNALSPTGSTSALWKDAPKLA